MQDGYGVSGRPVYGDFPSPFQLYSLLSAPLSYKALMDFCQRIFLTAGSYRAVMERVASYLPTDIEFIDTSPEEREKWEDYLHRRLKIIPFLKEVLLDVFCYGNAFISVVPLYRRWAACGSGCGLVLPFQTVMRSPILKATWKFPDLHAFCPRCRKASTWSLHDWKRFDRESLTLKRWAPQEIEIEYDPYSTETAYYWDIPAHYRDMIRRGHEFVLERADLAVIQAVAANKLYRFREDAIYHLREPCLAGVNFFGWGFPRTLLNYAQLYHMQTLFRANEAVAMDYLLPKRVISPMPTTSASGATAAGLPPDQLRMQSADTIVRQIQHALAYWRRDPTSVVITPYPLQMGILGGDLASMAPQQMLEYSQRALASDAGAPLELFNGSLQVHALPPALRLLENLFSHLVFGLNDLLDWICTKISQFQSWEKVQVRLRKLTLADSLERQMMAFNLMTQNLLSPTTALRELGYDHLQELRQKIDDMIAESEAQARLQKQLERSSMAEQMFMPPTMMPPGAAPPGGMMPPGAAPPAQGGGQPQAAPMPDPVAQMIASSAAGPRSLEEMEATAQTLAQELIALPDSLRLSRLRQLRQANEMLHSRVLELLRQMRQRVRSEAGARALAQYQQSPGYGF